MERVRPKPAFSSSVRRKSVFIEVGLTDEETVRSERSPAPALLQPEPSPARLRKPVRTVRFRSRDSIFGGEKEGEDGENSESDWEEGSDSDCDECDGSLSTMKLYSNGRTYALQRIHRLGILALVLALLLPVMQTGCIKGLGVRGRAIPSELIESSGNYGVVKREDTPTEICTRWSHQTAIVNGTLYIYGGRASTDPKQTSNTWNNDFLSIDLTKSWQISSPSLTGLPRPSGPPKVSNGYLWNSHDSLYLYGGEFSEDPEEKPSSNSMWEYNIAKKEWIEHQNPKSSEGVLSEGDGQPIQRAAEGAGFSVSTLGRGWYFGGHLDFLTTEGWSNQVERVYLKSLLEFTFPGFSNSAVKSLSDGKKAGSDGVWRNITEGGLQEKAGFTERADGLLVYIPGFGEEGILLGLTGGTDRTFTQMNVIDVYDIASSTWYKQTTTGKIPEYRVNPCATVAAAADGSSYNVYMFGGQNLVPYKEQIQYDDMWILSVPSFTWIKVDTQDSVPYARAGHTCNVWDGQMIVVGGYVGQNLSCDSPGIYVFNMSSLEWSTQFTALTGLAATEQWSGDSHNDNTANPLGQQANQRGFNSSAGLEGSYGYAVPAAVQSVIGGQATGGATLTAPVQTPTEGPLATGKPLTYTVTGADGAIITQTASPDPNASQNKGHKGPNIGAIIAGVIAGVFFLVAAYMAFCAWIYRKQVMLWKQHAAMASRSAQNPNSVNNEKDGLGLLGGTTAAGVGAAGVAGVGGTSSSSAKNSSERRPDLMLFPSTTESERAGTSSGGAGGVGAGARRSAETRGDEVSDSSTEDLLEGQEPTFWGSRGVLLNPRRSLRVINRD
ncbi:hypothetical protein GQ43DRAFT_444824 [Delitschia confertaspora ATCC 74209]|uniref:Kelch repeat protein n=1 Tax=Delitschia confertaspora ATCC 74209 TaxID=1513339 RepID=A0A9P4JC57_9PLEO|nr:hypothetical protein GQ43DRAFT_444824 [Delitschia confertaspora ATCC 74209]